MYADIKKPPGGGLEKKKRGGRSDLSADFLLYVFICQKSKEKRCRNDQKYAEYRKAPPALPYRKHLNQRKVEQIHPVCIINRDADPAQEFQARSRPHDGNRKRQR